MKYLNKEQKKILDEWYEQKKDYLDFYGFNWELFCYKGMTEKLLKIRDVEMIGLSICTYITKKILEGKGLKNKGGKK